MQYISRNYIPMDGEVNSVVKSAHFSSRGSLFSFKYPCQASYKCLQLQLVGFSALVLGSESITLICSNTDTLKYT